MARARCASRRRHRRVPPDERILQHPPEEVLAAVESYDSDRQALVITPAVALAPHPSHVAGRPIWGRRSAASVALEDKVTVDAFWDDVGVRRAPSEVVPIELDDLRRVGRRLDRGLAMRATAFMVGRHASAG